VVVVALFVIRVCKICGLTFFENFTDYFWQNKKATRCNTLAYAGPQPGGGQPGNGPTKFSKTCLVVSRSVVGWERVPTPFGTIATLLEVLYFSFQFLCVAPGAA